MLLQKLKTNKLFFGLYPYKITCRVDGATLLRTYKMDDILNNKTELLGYFYSRKFTDTKFIKKFIVDAEKYLKDKSIKRRIEQSNIDFYFKDQTVFQEFQQDLKIYISKITEPENDLDLSLLLEDTKYVLCNNLPYGKFKYKIIFKDMPASVRLSLINWAEKYSEDEIFVKKSTKIHFKNVKHKWGMHYFYVRDQKMITLISLASSGYVKRTEEFVIKSPTVEA